MNEKFIIFVCQKEADVKLNHFMKKTFFIIAIVAASFVIFTGCKKENKDEQKPPTEVSKGGNIDEIIKETGVDIYALAASSELSKYFEAFAPLSEKIAKSIKSKSSTDQKIARMNELVTLISQAAEDNDFELVNIYFEELVGLIDSMTGTVAFLECEFVQSLNEKADILINYLYSEYPSFFTLDNEQQRNVIDAIVEIIVPRGPVDDCKTRYRQAIMLAELCYVISVAECCFTGHAAWMCVGYPLGMYIVNVHYANQQLTYCLANP